MPFKSQAQNRWAHTSAGKRALGGSAKLKEWEKSTDFSKLPKKLERGSLGKHFMGKKK